MLNIPSRNDPLFLEKCEVLVFFLNCTAVQISIALSVVLGVILSVDWLLENVVLLGLEHPDVVRVSARVIDDAHVLLCTRPARLPRTSSLHPWWLSHDQVHHATLCILDSLDAFRSIRKEVAVCLTDSLLDLAFSELRQGFISCLAKVPIEDSHLHFTVHRRWIKLVGLRNFRQFWFEEQIQQYLTVITSVYPVKYYLANK